MQADALPPPPAGAVARAARAAYEWIASLMAPGDELEPYTETPEQRAGDYREVRSALAGESARALRDGGEDGAILSVAVPVQRFKQVQGALMLSTTIADVETSVREVRYAILKLFALGLGVTVLLSVFLASTIARPVRRLAEAADAVRPGRRGGVEIPDFSGRGDEIGDLSRALREMTDALSERIDAEPVRSLRSSACIRALLEFSLRESDCFIGRVLFGREKERKQQQSVVSGT